MKAVRSHKPEGFEGIESLVYDAAFVALLSHYN